MSIFRDVWGTLDPALEEASTITTSERIETLKDFQTELAKETLMVSTAIVKLEEILVREKEIAALEKGIFDIDELEVETEETIVKTKTKTTIPVPKPGEDITLTEEDLTIIPMNKSKPNGKKTAISEALNAASKV